MKLSEAFSEHRKNEVLAMNYSPRTFQSYINAEKKAIGFFGNVEVSSITLDGTHGLFLSMLSDCCSDTARSYLSKLKVVIRYCKIHGEDTLEPELIKLPRKEKKVARFLTVDEFDQFLCEVDRSHRGYKGIDRIRNAIIVELLFTTGLRVGELCALNRDSIQDRQFVVVGKSKEPRVCFITKEMERKINAYLRMRCDGERALFIDSFTGQRVKPCNIQRIFRRVSKATGLSGCTPHTMRHSYATYLVEEGVDIRYVAALLGHQSLQTTQKYTHIRDHKLQQVYDATMQRF